MKIIYGDLVKYTKEGKFDIVVHGCNCFHTMESGIAKQIKKEFPESYNADKKTQLGCFKLGTCSYAYINRQEISFLVVNAYTQCYYSRDKKCVDYGAIKQCFEWVKDNMLNNRPHPMRIGIPKIGAGLGGGDWNIISKIIDEEMKGEDLTLVCLD